jgi:hypothetical protein
MRGIMAVVVILCVVVIGAGCATFGQKGLEDMVVDDCKAEIDSYCKNVTPGEARVLACLYAYEDKLSNRCEYALYEAVTQLQLQVTTLAYVANECHDDLKTYCSGIEPGEGRLKKCLDKNKDKISARCKQARKDAGQ